MKSAIIGVLVAFGVAATVYPADARPLAGRPAVRHFTSQYAGQVVTVTGAFPGASAVAFDADHQVFYAFASGEIYQVTLAGVASPLCAFNAQSVGGLAYDSSDQSIYATDTRGFAVYSISSTCTTTLVAGGNRGTNDGQGATAQFQNPTGVALDATHQVLYVADVDRIRAVTVVGAVTTFTTPGTIGQLGYQYNDPVTVGLALDASAGVLYVADATRGMIEAIDSRGHLRWIAGRCISLDQTTCHPLQVDGAASKAGFAAPSGVVLNPADGELYVADTSNNSIRRMLSRTVSTLAGSGIFGKTDGAGIVASFSLPQGLAIDPASGLMLVADQFTGLLRLVTTHGTPPPPPHHGSITYDPPTYLSYPNSITVTSDGVVWFAEHDVNRIGRLGLDGKFREFSLPRLRGYPRNMITGADGAPWFSDTSLVSGGLAAVARISSTGAVTEYLVSHFTTEVDALTVGSDGNVWFANYSDGDFGYVTPGGLVQQFSPGYNAILGGFDGNIWTGSLQSQSAVFYRYSTTGMLLNTYGLPQGYAQPPANGPNQSIWFLFSGLTRERIAELSIDGTLQYLNLKQDPGCFASGGNLALAPNGYEWYVWSEYCNGFQSPEIARTNVTGKTMLFPVYAARSAPAALAFGPDGTVWFADPGSDKIGKIY
jgi:streptogramin lyase